LNNKTKIGYYAGWASVILNTLLFVVKYWAGTQANSIAMIADAWHTLSDTLTSFIVIIGFWISSKPPDKEHPFGYGRVESIAAIVIATLLGVVAIEFILESIDRISNPVVTNYSTNVIIIFALSIVVKEIMAQYSYRIGKKLNSESLKADGWHHRSDAVTTLVIVIGAIFSNNIVWIDAVLGLIVSILILYAGYKILRSSINSLIGESPKKKMVDDITSAIASIDHRISDIHNYKIHTYGDLKEMTVHLRLPNDLSVEESHKITKKIEQHIYNKRSIKVTVHVEPEN
jgi:cation diffusion facilitator family transporter